MKLNLYNASQLRTRLIQTAREKISRSYKEASEQIQQYTNRVTNTVPNDAVLNVGDYRQVEKEARQRYREVSKGVRSTVTDTMVTVSAATFNEFDQTMISHGKPGQKTNIMIPKNVVQNILNGTIYQKPDNLGTKDFNWGLSKAIWGDERKTMSDIHKIIASGVARGASAMDIAADIEKYTNPDKNKSKDFDWGKVYPGVKTKIDYNASRLARTLVSHAYQQSFKTAGEANPWISHYIWQSAFAHGRTCQVCMDLDGQLFAKDNDPNPKYPPLPLDHPNGLCDWLYEFDDKGMVNDLADWVNGTGDTSRNEQIDEYENFLKGR